MMHVDEPSTPPQQTPAPDTATARLLVDEYEEPKLEPQNKEEEGDFWCD